MRRIFILFCFLALLAASIHARPQRQADGPLRFGLLATTEALPFVVAYDMGFYQEEGVEVELIIFANPQERDAALQAGRLDGVISDLLASFYFADAGFDYRITSLTSGRFGIVASPQSGITRLEELRGRSIGFFPNTMTQHIADTLLEEAGVSMFDYEPVAVPNILVRFEMLMNGHVDAAVVPEPFVTTAAAQGATVLASTDDTDLALGTFYFSRTVLNNRTNEVTAFHRAYYRAVREINANPDAFRDHLVERINFPVAVRDQFQFYTFERPVLPTEQQVRRASDWLMARDLLDTRRITRADLIDARPTTGW